jgi:hypothetical protein
MGCYVRYEEDIEGLVLAKAGRQGCTGIQAPHANTHVHRIRSREKSHE